MISLNLTEITTLDSSAARIPEHINDSLSCYESIEEFADKRKLIWFWLEGVMLFAVGIPGLFGNILAILTLGHTSENTSFNILLK